jgi:hypothetical protein
MTATIIGFAKAILVAAIATCDVATAENPDELESPDQTQVDQHFCCFSVGDGSNGKGSGEAASRSAPETSTPAPRCCIAKGIGRRTTARSSACDA